MKVRPRVNIDCIKCTLKPCCQKEDSSTNNKENALMLTPLIWEFGNRVSRSSLARLCSHRLCRRSCWLCKYSCTAGCVSTLVLLVIDGTLMIYYQPASPLFGCLTLTSAAISLSLGGFESLLACFFSPTTLLMTRSSRRSCSPCSSFVSSFVSSSEDRVGARTREILVFSSSFHSGRYVFVKAEKKKYKEEIVLEKCSIWHRKRTALAHAWWRWSVHHNHSSKKNRDGVAISTLAVGRGNNRQGGLWIGLHVYTCMDWISARHQRRSCWSA